MAGRSAVDDPLKSFRFVVEVEGFARVGFMEANGLELTTEMVEYREGGDNATVRKSPGLTSFANIVLRRGQFIGSSKGGDDDFAEWAQEVFDTAARAVPNDFRKTLDIVQYHRDGGEARRWRLFECVPSRYKPASDFNATANEDSIEELEVAHEGFVLL